MALDAEKCAAAFEEITKATTTETPVNETAQKYAAAFHDYIKGGTLPGCNMQAGGAEALLIPAFTAPTLPAAMGAAICGFLNTILTPGLPAHGGTVVVSVLVLGSSMAAAMGAAISAVVTDKDRPEAYLYFIKEIENIIKVVPCTITETMPNGAPGIFPGFIT